VPDERLRDDILDIIDRHPAHRVRPNRVVMRVEQGTEHHLIRLPASHGL
jgi:hypothetical protein